MENNNLNWEDKLCVLRNGRQEILLLDSSYFLSVVGVSGVVYYQTSQKTQAIEDNGYYECSGKFDSKMTPVSNMLIILKIINGSNFCDDGWYQEVQECQSILNKQIQENI